MIQQKILPVISDWKTFERFLKTKDAWCILMGFHINFMEDMLAQLHEHGKKAVVHMDLVNGLANDAYGTQYLCQKCHVDGIISTKSKAIEQAKKNHCISILRVFLIDSRSVEMGGKLAAKLNPDFVEVLPAIVPQAVQMMREYCDSSIIGGGLIKNKKDIEACLDQGMVSVTTSNLTFCEEV